MDLATATTGTSLAQRRAALWSAGRTAWRLPPTPRSVYEQIRERWGANPFVLLAHRNFAKTTLALTIADEECRRQPRQRWAIALKTKDQSRDVIREIMEHYLLDCPAKLRPRPVKSDYTWIYPNGSGLYFFGGDNEHIETARGRGFHGAIFDEGGFQQNLRRNVKSVMLPALAKLGRGQLIITSTPSLEPGHDFEELCSEARAAGRFAEVEVMSNPDLSPEWIADRAAECGGAETLDFLREYRCQFVADPNTTVLPGVTEARIAGTDGKPALVQAVDRNLLREWYAGMDIGGKHLTGILWGYYDHDADAVRIAAELVHRNASTPELARDITAKELELFGSRFPDYFERWADNNNLFLLHDLGQPPYRIRFSATRKDEKMSQIGALRRLIAEGRFIVDPQCDTLIRTLKTAQWATSGKGFAESTVIGHADLLDAALYLVRNVRRRPYPAPMPTMEQQIGMPGAPSGRRTRGMRDLAQRLQTEGWTEDE